MAAEDSSGSSYRGVAAGAAAGPDRAAVAAVAGSNDAAVIAAADRFEWHLAPVDPSEDMGPAAQSLSSQGRPFRVHADWRAALDAASPDVAVVNPPFHRIAEVTLECLQRGIHVLAEKPLATEWEGLAALKAFLGPEKTGLAHAGLPSGPGAADPAVGPSAGAASGSAPKLMGMFSMRYEPAYHAGYLWVRSGGLGRPVLMSAQKSYPREGWDGRPRPAFYRSREAYGGTIPWIGIHALDLFRWFADAPIVRLRASHSPLGGDWGEMEAAASLQCTLASGTLASAQVDFLRRRAGGEPWGDDRLRIVGDKGVLEIRDGRAWAIGEDGIRRELQASASGPGVTSVVRHSQDTSGFGASPVVDASPGAPRATAGDRSSGAMTAAGSVRGATAEKSRAEGRTGAEAQTHPTLFGDFLAWIETDAPMRMTTEDCLAATEAALKARDAADGRT